jgi:hypothetical protein
LFILKITFYFYKQCFNPLKDFMKIKAILILQYEYYVNRTYNRNFCWIFIQSIIGFAGGLVALPFFVCNAIE